MGSEHLQARAVGDGVGHLIFDHPSRLNALSFGMVAALPQAIHELECNPDVRVVVLSGAGEQAFISGIDLSSVQESSAENGETELDFLYQEALASIRSSLKPTIAMVSGFCIGAGVAVALASDIRVCDEKSEFSIPAAKIGIGYADVQPLLDLVGPGWTSEILFTGRRLSSEEALSARLVNQVVAAGQLETAVRDLAISIADNAPLSIVTAKTAIREARKDAGQRDSDLVSDLVARCRESADFAEGTRAFLEKRRPQFTGT